MKFNTSEWILKISDSPRGPDNFQGVHIKDNKFLGSGQPKWEFMLKKPDTC